MRKSDSKSIWFIFITLLIDITGWGLIIPVMPDLIANIIGGNISDASWYGGWLGFAYAFAQFLFAPLLGSLSDKYGRRPVLLLSLLGFAANYVFLYYAHTIALLFIGRIISGITGASITTASAYIADISTDENRSQNFGMIGAAFGLGFILGPILGGLLGHYGERVPFMAAAILCFLNFLYGYFVLPESLDKQHRKSFELKKANPVGSLMFLKSIPAAGKLIIALLLVFIAQHAVNSTWNFFTMEKFGWDTKMVGISLGAIGLFLGLVQGGLIRITKKKLGDEKSVYWGMLFYAIGLFLIAFTSNQWLVFLFLVPYCLGGIAGPSLQSIITSQVALNEQGKLQGALTSLMSATAMIGPPIMTGLFHFFTQKNAPVYFPGAAFLLGAFIMLASSVIAYYALHHKTKR